MATDLTIKHNHPQNDEPKLEKLLTISPFAIAAAEEGGSSGMLLKFAKGHFLAGEEEVALGTQFVADMNSYRRGWDRWYGGKITKSVTGFVVDGFVIPERDTLGDLDGGTWEIGNDGEPKDPWTRVSYIDFYDLRDGAAYTFTSSSDGGRRAVAKLSGTYDRRRWRYPGQMPIVTIGVGSYQHPIKEYGRVYVPVFTVNESWAPWGESAAPAPALPAPPDRGEEKIGPGLSLEELEANRPPIEYADADAEF